MNYMWEALLQGEELGIAKGDIHFVPSPTSNPYREVSFTDFNRTQISAEPVEVNAHYRYSAVFGALLAEDMDGHPELRAALFDIMAHYLTELDLRTGLHRAEYYARFLRADIQNGLFGRENAKRLDRFSTRQKSIIGAGLLRMLRVGTSMKLLAQLLRELYPQSITYLDARDVRELLIYVGKKQSPDLSAQMKLLCDLFVPADYDVKLFWELHFGLIGTEETMDIGGVMMY